MLSKFKSVNSYLTLMALAFVLSAGLLIVSVRAVYFGNADGIEGTHADFPQELLVFRASVFISMLLCFVISFRSSRGRRYLSLFFLSFSLLVYAYWRHVSTLFLRENHLSSPPDFLRYSFGLRAASQSDALLLLIIIFSLFYTIVKLANAHRVIGSKITP